MAIATNTTNFNLDLIDKEEQEVGDTVRILRTIQNANMSNLDNALQTLSVNSAGYISVSGLHTVVDANRFLDPSTACTISLYPTVTAGKEIAVSRVHTITFAARGKRDAGSLSSMVNDLKTTSVTKAYVTTHPLDENIAGSCKAVKLTATTWKIY